MSETGRYRVIDTSRTIADDIELITSLLQKYGLVNFKNMLDKALNQVAIAQKEEAACAEKIAKETFGLNEQRQNSLWRYSRLFNANSVNPEPLQVWLSTRSKETLQKIASEIKQNKRGMRDIFHGNVENAILMLEQEITRKNQQKATEKPKENIEDKAKKSLNEKLKAFVS